MGEAEEAGRDVTTALGSWRPIADCPAWRGTHWAREETAGAQAAGTGTDESQGCCAGSQAPPPLPGAVIDPRLRHVGTFYSCYKTKRNNGWGRETPVWSGRPVTELPSSRPLVYSG